MGAAPMNIYVENKIGVEADYQVTEEAVRSALADVAKPDSVTVRSADDPDLAKLSECDYFIGSGFNTERLRKHAERVRVVHCTSAGVESYLPLDWLNNGAVLTNSSGVHAEKGGAFGAMAVLMLNEGIPRHVTNQKRHVWDNTLSTAITGKTVLIYGLGSLGEAIAARLKSFGLRILGIRRSGEPHPLADTVSSPDQLEKHLAQAHFLVLTCPLTPETQGLIGRKEISLLPQGAGILNMARAGVLDNSALADALRAGHLSGAVIDVFDPEPLPEDAPWWDVPNLVISPHISCDDSVGYTDRCLAIFAENMARLNEGRELRNVVDGSRGY